MALGRKILQWIQILCGVTFMQISCEPLVRSTWGLQHWVQNWHFDNSFRLHLTFDISIESVKFYMHMESGYRDICMRVTPQSIWIHCRPHGIFTYPLKDQLYWVRSHNNLSLFSNSWTYKTRVSQMSYLKREKKLFLLHPTSVSFWTS